VGTREGAAVGDVVGLGVGSPAAEKLVTVVVIALADAIPALTITLLIVDVKTE